MFDLLSADTDYSSLHKKSSEKEHLCQRLREQLDALEKETASKLSEMDVFNNQLKVLSCYSFFDVNQNSHLHTALKVNRTTHLYILYICSSLSHFLCLFQLIRCM